MTDQAPLTTGGSFCEPLSEDQLKALLSGRLANGYPPAVIESVERKVRKRRMDWRGARLFERVTVRMAGGGALTLFLKYRRGDPNPGGARSEPPVHAR